MQRTKSSDSFARLAKPQHSFCVCVESKVDFMDCHAKFENFARN
ncbi:hypothetical protein [Helicobacter fennelliae]|nr:hypothetical protein [Helicobacter fennelliae]